LDENATAAAADIKQREERIAMIDRVMQHKAGGTVAEYEGSYGQIQRLSEEAKLYSGWGNMGDLAGYSAVETTHAGLDQASIDRASTYRTQQGEAQKKKKKLADEAGTESGQAEVLSRQIGDDKAAAGRALRVLNDANIEYHEVIVSALQTVGLTQAQLTAEIKIIHQQLANQATQSQ
jgi:ribosome-binding protein aMBF1 (putative translation factor)